MLVDHRQLSVVGLSEVAAHLKVIYRAWRTITAYLTQHSPNVLVLIDFPDFNLLLARVAKRRGHQGLLLYQPAGLGVAKRQGQNHPAPGG